MNGLVIKETIAIAKIVINMEDLPSPIALITEITGKTCFSRYVISKFYQHREYQFKKFPTIIYHCVQF